MTNIKSKQLASIEDAPATRHLNMSYLKNINSIKYFFWKFIQLTNLSKIYLF